MYSYWQQCGKKPAGAKLLKMREDGDDLYEDNNDKDEGN